MFLIFFWKIGWNYKLFCKNTRRVSGGSADDFRRDIIAAPHGMLEIQLLNIVWTSWWNPYLPVALEWQILINLLLPPLFRVKVYSPFRLEASLTKNVPSGASRSFSLTSSRVISPQYHSWATNAGSPSGWPEHINFYQSDINFRQTFVS